MNEIQVSIICNTYNQKDYIKGALDSFIMQKTNFAFEILVHDDASTDGTADIVREYEKKYPDLIKPIYQMENQYSQGVRITLTFQAPRAKGKYIAFCEGDDYWTDPLKLQKQYVTMEEHPEVDMCAHKTLCLDARTNKVVGYSAPVNETTTLAVERVIFGGGMYIATNSLFYRKELYDNIPPFRKLYSLDYTLQIHGALRGGMLYLNDCMSVYRVQAKGSWTNHMRLNVGAHIAHYNKVQEMLIQLNIDTKNQYINIIKKTINNYKYSALAIENQYKKLLTKEYKEVYQQLSFKDRIKVRIKAYFPFLVKWARKHRKKSINE